MNKNILIFSGCALLFSSFVQAEKLLIDPSKAGQLRCDDSSFRNESHILSGPEQDFVFTASDGQTHSITFKDYQECHAHKKFVETAQKENNHRWVEIETSTLDFAEVLQPPLAVPVSKDVPVLRESHTK